MLVWLFLGVHKLDELVCWVRVRLDFLSDRFEVVVQIRSFPLFSPVFPYLVHLPASSEEVDAIEGLEDVGAGLVDDGDDGLALMGKGFDNLDDLEGGEGVKSGRELCGCDQSTPYRRE